MPYIDPETIRRVKQLDLLTYLQSYEPHELVRISSGQYTTREHDSLKLSNGKWYWWSRNIGGRSALDFLIKVRGMEFTKAVEYLVDVLRVPPVIQPPEPVARSIEKSAFNLPKIHTNNAAVVSYLMNRGIDRAIIGHEIESGKLYQSVNKGKNGKVYHNAVFVGFDLCGVPRFATQRGLSDTVVFRGDIAGSDKRFAYCCTSNSMSEHLHVFECPIDLLSYQTLIKQNGGDWREHHSLALVGVHKPPKDAEATRVPVALSEFLQTERVSHIYLHLDNDETGRAASAFLCKMLEKDYTVSDEPPPQGKDYNDYLKMKIQNAESRQQQAALLHAR